MNVRKAATALESRSPLIFLLGLANLLVAVVWQVLVYFQIGLVRLHIVGAYSELKQYGVVSEPNEASHFASELESDPFYMPLGFLVGEELDEVQTLCYAVTAYLVLAAALSIILSPRRRSRPNLAQV